MIFDERLTELRKETPFNQKDFANELGLEPSKYNKWENGKTVPDFETVITLAKYFNVTVDYLVGNSDVRKWENAGINSELGLTDKSIEVIKSLKISNTKLTPDDPDFLESDSRLLIDVFNDFIEDEYNFKHFLTALKYLSNWGSYNEYIEPEKQENDIGSFRNISVFDTKHYLYKQLLNELLDAIITELEFSRPIPEYKK